MKDVKNHREWKIMSKDAEGLVVQEKIVLV